jgi:hypothetical protein
LGYRTCRDVEAVADRRRRKTATAATNKAALLPTACVPTTRPTEQLASPSELLVGTAAVSTGFAPESAASWTGLSTVEESWPAPASHAKSISIGDVSIARSVPGSSALNFTLCLPDGTRP